VLTVALSWPAFAADTASGAQVFSVHCAGCHPNGGNIIRRGKNLSQKALKKYNMDSVEAIASLVANGKNNMSAFKNRLSADQIEAVAAYVLSRSEKGWR
jgi:cytochrome c6